MFRKAYEAAEAAYHARSECSNAISIVSANFWSEQESISERQLSWYCGFLNLDKYKVKKILKPLFKRYPYPDPVPARALCQIYKYLIR